MPFLRLNGAFQTAAPTPTVVNTQNIAYIEDTSSKFTDIHTRDDRQIRVHETVRDVMNAANKGTEFPAFIMLHRTDTPDPAQLVVNVSAIQSIEQFEGWNLLRLTGFEKSGFGVRESQDEILALIETPTNKTPAPTGLVRDFYHS